MPRGCSCYLRKARQPSHICNQLSALPTDAAAVCPMMGGPRRFLVRWYARTHQNQVPLRLIRRPTRERLPVFSSKIASVFKPAVSNSRRQEICSRKQSQNNNPAPTLGSRIFWLTKGEHICVGGGVLDAPFPGFPPGCKESLHTIGTSRGRSLRRLKKNIVN